MSEVKLGKRIEQTRKYMYQMRFDYITLLKYYICKILIKNKIEGTETT